MQPYKPFAPQLASSPAGVNEWATARQGAGAWVQILCPAAVRIWKIRLRGRSSDRERITSWSLVGGNALTTLLTSNITLGSLAQEFLVDMPAGTAYATCRLNKIMASTKPVSTGISHFQIFTRNI